MRSARLLVRLRLWMAILAAVAAPVAGLAQSPAAADSVQEAKRAPATPSWGIASRTSHTLTALDFVPFSSGNTFIAVGGTANRFFNGAWVGALHLPNGAVIDQIEIEGCDSSAVGEISALFVRAPVPAGDSVVLEDVTTGIGAEPGCVNLAFAVNPTVVVDNASNRYVVQIDTTGNSSDVRFAAVHVGYRLQVSAAPAVPTFPSDVPPSHPFFRFIEALAAAGITAGCAPGSYCPNNPITRGEMAVFLAAALGLHFPG